MIRALWMLTGVQIILQDILRRMHTHQSSCCLYYHHKEFDILTSVEGPQQEDKTSG